MALNTGDLAVKGNMNHQFQVNHMCVKYCQIHHVPHYHFTEHSPLSVQLVFLARQNLGLPQASVNVVFG